MASRFASRTIAAIMAASLISFVPGAASSDDSAEEKQLRKELQEMRQALQRVEKRVEQQDEVIRKLSTQPAAAPAALPGTAPRPAPAATATTMDTEQLRKDITAEIQKKIQPQLAAANKTFASQFNPAIGFVIDTAYAHYGKSQDNFEFRSGEIGISASVDPFARGYAILNGTNDGVEVEEAAIVTTSLPWNLTVKGGRFFADYGRLSKFHDHDLPFVNRPTVLDTYVGGESQSDGLEVSWLAPLQSQYITFTGGAYDKMGAENDRVDNNTPRDISEFTYMGRVATYFALGDAHGLDLGVSDAYTPEVEVDNNHSRNLVDVDLTYRYTPLSQAAYRGLIWGSEFLVNSERQGPAFDQRNSFGMYTYLEAMLTRVFRPGFLFEYTNNINEDDEEAHGDTIGYSPYLTIWPSEFQRLRLQYTYQDAPHDNANEFFLQWTVVLGSHVHGFRDR
jgi:hypothetical protein